MDINIANHGSKSCTFNRLESGAGASYNLTKHVAATGEYLHIFGDNQSEIFKAATLNMFLIGAKITFF